MGTAFHPVCGAARRVATPGTGFIYNFVDDDYDLPEIRPVAGLQVHWPRLGDFTFRHFVRLELRMLYLGSTSEWDATFRGRYQLQLTSPNFAIGNAADYFALTSAEFFDNLGSSNTDFIGDRFRYNVGLGKGNVFGLRITLSYMFHKVRVPDSEQRMTFELDDHVVRLTFVRRFN